jgi:hypothetical protein
LKDNERKVDGQQFNKTNNLLVFLRGGESVQAFYRLFYICLVIGNPIIKRERFGISLNILTLPHFCACPMTATV